MRYYEASSMIAPDPAAVRAVLTEGAAWPSRDPGLIWRLMPDLGPSSGRFAQGVRRRAGTGR
jgi:hypothetical protein